MKINKLLFGLVICAGFSSCTGDYTDWADPQSNEAKEAAEKFVMTVQPTVSSVKFADVTTDSIQLFTTNLQEGQTDQFNVSVYNSDNSNSVDVIADTDGRVAKTDLEQAVISMYGKAPVERALTMDVAADVKVTVAECTVSVRKSASYNMTATPDAPVIESAYYLVGDMCGWDADHMIKFTHSDKDVYEDPVFYVTFTCAGDGKYWKIIPQSNVDAGNIWADGVVGTKVDGDESMSGLLVNIDAKAGKIAQAGKYRMAIDMLNGTYEITKIPDVPEYYMVGTPNKWSLSTASALYPTSANTASYTSYFTGAWDCRIATTEQISAGNWSNIGAETDNSGSCTKLIENTGNCISAPSAGYYTLNVDFSTMTYSWQAVSPSASYEKIGLVGAGDDWDNDIVLQQVACNDGKDTHNWAAIGVEVKAATWGMKFRANGGWDVSWGGCSATAADKYSYGASVKGSNDNITGIEAGTYNIYFNDITGQFFFVKQ